MSGLDRNFWRTRGLNWRPDALVRQVIEVHFLRGEGVEHDPVREITAYFDMTGVLLAENDPHRSPKDPQP